VEQLPQVPGEDAHRKCPENILPNALKSVDEIIKQHGLTVLP
jgi:hypothetical protein